MEKVFVERFMAAKAELRAKFISHPESYEELVRYVIEVISDPNKPYDPDPTRIHCIDEGDYQGTLLFVIAAKGYQPDDYWSVKVSYGSCSGCDTLQGIRYDNSGDYNTPTPQQIDDYMTLALHIVQELKAI